MERLHHCLETKAGKMRHYQWLGIFKYMKINKIFI